MADNRHTALLISDVQNDFCSPGGKVYDRAIKHPEMLTTLVRELGVLSEAARDSGIKVVYVQNMHLPGGADVTPAHLQYLKKSGLSGSVDDISCVAGSWGYQVVDALKPRSGDIAVDKFAFNSLDGSMIDKVLRAQEVETVVLTGISSYSGVLATTFGLRDRGYEFSVVRECVTGYEPELHDAAMKIISPYAVSSAEIRAAWRAAS